MTNEIETIVGRIENVNEFNHFGFVKTPAGETVLLAAHVLFRSGFQRQELSADADIVCEVESTDKGLRATRVVSIGGRVGETPKARQSKAKRAPKRAKQPKAEPAKIAPASFTHRVIDRVDDVELVKVAHARDTKFAKVGDLEQYVLRTVDADGNVVRTEPLGRVSLAVAREALGRPFAALKAA